MKFLLAGWSKLEEFILVILFAFMAVMNFINVVARYALASSFSFTEEITITAFVWVSMIGVAAGYKRVAHLGMSFVVDNMPKKVQPFMALFSMFCSALLMAILLKCGIDYVANQVALGSRTAALNMPMWVQGLSIPVGSFFCLIRSIEAGIGEFKRLNNEAKGAVA